MADGLSLQGTPAMGVASAKAAALETRTSNISATIKALDKVPGKRSDDVAALDTVKARYRTLEDRFRGLWHVEVVAPVEQARQEVRNAEEKKDNASVNARATRESLERELQRLHERRARLSPDEMQRLDEQADVLRRRIEDADVAASAASVNVRDALERLPAILARTEQLAISRMADLDALLKEADALVDEVAALYERINGKQSLVSVGKTVTLNRDQFLAARDYHRTAATLAMWIIGAAVGVFALGVFFVFLRLDPDAAKLAVTADGKPNWPVIIEIAAGRLSLLIAAAWLIRFTGRLHSRHIQQAVSYQNRVAALDAAKTILEVGNEHERTEALGKMAAYYLAPGDNAFEERAPQESASRQVERTVRLLIKPLDTLAKAVGEKASGN